MKKLLKQKILLFVWLFLVICAKAQTYQHIPWYPNDDRIKQEITASFNSDTLIFMVYQPDCLLYDTNIRRVTLWTENEDGKIYSFVYVVDKNPNIIVFHGDTVVEKRYSRENALMIKELLQMDSVWVDDSEAQLKVIIPFMFPEECDIVVLYYKNKQGCFQLSNKIPPANICFDLNPNKKNCRETFVKKLKQMISWFKFEPSNTNISPEQ